MHYIYSFCTLSELFIFAYKFAFSYSNAFLLLLTLSKFYWSYYFSASILFTFSRKLFLKSMSSLLYLITATSLNNIKILNYNLTVKSTSEFELLNKSPRLGKPIIINFSLMFLIWFCRKSFLYSSSKLDSNWGSSWLSYAWNE